MLNVLIFPIIASWVWGGGWLSKIGYQDFGGSGFHIVGGTCGLVGANFLGPRLGLFNDSLPITENKIREKLERKEHTVQNYRVDQAKKLAEIKDLVFKYLNKNDVQERQYFTEQYGWELIDQTVIDIYRKIFVNSSAMDLGYMRDSRKRTLNKLLMDAHFAQNL